MIMMTKNIQISLVLSKNEPILGTFTWWKKGQKIRAWVTPPPFSGNARKKTCFHFWCLPLIDTSYLHLRQLLNNCNSMHNFCVHYSNLIQSLQFWLIDMSLFLFASSWPKITKLFQMVIHSHQASCASSSSSFSGVSRVVSTELGASLNIIIRLNFAECVYIEACFHSQAIWITLGQYLELL